jgi:5-methylcytosine-specific restriction enzyme subunit McrC
LKDRVHGLLLLFPDLADLQVSARTFENLVFDRKTSHYQEAMEIAALLLLNYRPDISAGRNHVLAILFDMNDLWEEYIYRKLLQNKPAHWSIQVQNSKSFWAMSDGSYTKSIKPDLIICDQKASIAVDTKWKLPENNVPADADLKQMYVYNEYWKAKNALLLYPHAENKQELSYFEGTFAGKSNGTPDHGCGILKVSVLDRQHSLDQQLGSQMINFLEQEFKK